MKIFKKSTIKKALLTCLTVFVTTFCAALGFGLLHSVDANAAAISSTVFQTNGASVRVLKWNGDAYEETDRKGIRFHVEMGAGYEISSGVALLDASTPNSNGSHKMAEGYKSYTLVIPTRLMSGTELTMDTSKVQKIDTTEYWFNDSDGNWESVAYIYNIPEARYTDEFTYRGIIVSVDAEGNETLVKSTPMETRTLAWVAKQAYLDTISGDYSWGSPEEDEYAASEIKKLFPVYNVVYSNGKTEEVLWGDKLTQADSSKTYYDETNHEPVEVNLPLEMPVGGLIVLKETTEATFVFTGVEYTEKGFNVFATLPTASFANGTSLAPSSIDMVTAAGYTVKASSVEVSVVGGEGIDAITKLQIGFSYDHIPQNSQLTILKSSHFYNDGVLYELEEDYTFVYYNKSWELPLGYISIGDIKSITNFSETNANGVEKNVRIVFNSDILVNGGASFKVVNAQGALEDGGVTITRKQGGSVETITDGYYYWNQGTATILEIPGMSGGNKWGERDGDVLKIAAGTRLYQNGGYYVIQEDIIATFNGQENWNLNLNRVDITASNFTAVNTRQEGDSIYIDVNTDIAWADRRVEVVVNGGTIVYHDTNNVSQYVPSQIVYHGEGGNKILRIHIDRFSLLGDWVTIPANTSFWVGDNVYTLTEDIISYFVNKDVSWITNPDVQMVNMESFPSAHWESSNRCLRLVTSKSWSAAENNRVYVDDTYIDGEGVIVEGSNYSEFYYYGERHGLLELRGANFSNQGGSLTFKAGTYLWLFDNSTLACTGAYLFEEDVKIELEGGYGSGINRHREEEVFTLYRKDIRSVEDNFDIDQVNGEVRLWLQHSITGPITESSAYVSMSIVGNANLDGTTSTVGQCYGTNKLIAVLGMSGRGRAAGAVFTLEAGTKLYLDNGIGYIMVGEDIQYIWNGSAWLAYEEYTVNFNTTNATVKVNGTPVTSYRAYQSSKLTFSVEASEGYYLMGVEGATNNGDGTYTVVVSGNMSINVTAIPVIKLDASAILLVQAYDETKVQGGAPDLTGVRFVMDASSAFKNITAHHRGLSWNGEVTATVAGGVYYAIAFGTDNFFELRFATANLKNGDQVKIAAGTVFYGGGNGGTPYAIEWTEDIVATWFGGWRLEKENLGVLDWNKVGIKQIYSYSDFDSNTGNPLNSTIRIDLGTALFNGTSGGGGAIGNMTIDGAQYTGTYYYHGGGNKILQISEWAYAQGQTLVIKAGTKIIINDTYYITANTLTATCQANGSGANWTFTIS